MSSNGGDWSTRILGMSLVPAGLLVAAGLGLSWLANYLLGGAGHVPPHFFYIPILIAAARFDLVPTLMTAAVAGVLAGPLLPLDVALGTEQRTSDWIGRTAFFMGNSVVMWVIIARLKSAVHREVELKSAEQELARHKEAVIQTVSHEFLTPLTMIRGSTEFLARPGVVSDEARPLVDGLERAAARLDGLVRVVLAASDTLIDPARRRDEQIDLRSLCEDPRVDFVAEPGAETVVANRELLTLVLGEVIDNALKFSPPNTRVDVHAHVVEGTIQIRVTDRGPGMSEEERAYAFEPFVQKDESVVREQQGLGLGLFAARRAVELLGGTLELRPGAEGGTEAVIIVPR